jgi:hypothetical protein
VVIHRLVSAAVRDDLRALPEEVQASALASAAVALARRLDDRETPAAAAASVARELREALAVLQARAPKSGADVLDEIAATRAKRRVGVAQ